MSTTSIDSLLDARRANVDAMTTEEYQTLIDAVGVMSSKQLERCTKEGKADHLRDVAREEIVARAARSGWKPNLGIAIAIAAVAIATLAWLFPRAPSP